MFSVIGNEICTRTVNQLSCVYNKYQRDRDFVDTSVGHTLAVQVMQNYM